MSDLDKEPHIDYGPRSLTGRPSTYESIQTAAKELGVDTRGMSQRQAEAAVQHKRDVESDMAKFVNKVLDARQAASPPISSSQGNPEPTSSRTQTHPNPLLASKDQAPPPASSIPLDTLKFFAVHNGVPGYVTLAVISGFTQV